MDSRPTDDHEAMPAPQARPAQGSQLDHQERRSDAVLRSLDANSPSAVDANQQSAACACQQTTAKSRAELPKVVSFSQLATCGDEIWIENNGQLYRLRRTSQGKLILTK